MKNLEGLDWVIKVGFIRGRFRFEDKELTGWYMDLNSFKGFLRILKNWRDFKLYRLILLGT